MTSKEMLKKQIEKLHSEIVRIRGPWEKLVKDAENTLEKAELDERESTNNVEQAKNTCIQIRNAAKEKLKEAETYYQLARENVEKAGLCEEEAKCAVIKSKTMEEEARSNLEAAINKKLSAKENLEGIITGGMPSRAKHLCRVLQVKISKLECRINNKRPYKDGCVSVHPVYEDRS